MGSLAGHVIPGIFFLAYGLNWIIQSIWIHLTFTGNIKKKPKDSPRRKSCSCMEDNSKFEDKLLQRSWLPLCVFQNFPLEPILKIVLPALAIFVELFLDYDYNGIRRDYELTWKVYRLYEDDGFIRDQGKMHHITMHSAFILSGVTDIIVMFLSFPAYTSKLILSLAFCIEFILFHLHTGGRDEFNIQVHSILVFIIFMCLVFSLLRLASSANLAINIGLGSCILLQGTWLIQAGYFLFSSFLRSRGGKSKSEHVHHQLLMFFGEIFVWHVLLIAIGNLIVTVVLSFVVNKRILRKSSAINVDVEECRDLISSHKKIYVEEEVIELDTKN